MEFLKPERMEKVYFLFHRGCLAEVLRALRKAGCVHLTDIKEEIPHLEAVPSKKVRVQENLEKVHNLKSSLLARELSSPEKLLGPRKVPVKIISSLPEFEELEQRIEELQEELNRLNRMKSRLKSRLKEVNSQIEPVKREFLTEDSLLRQEYLSLIQQRDEISKEIQIVDTKIGFFMEKIRNEVLFLEDITKNYLSREEAIENFGKTGYTVAISGWVPEPEIEGLKRKLEKACEGLLFSSRPPMDEEPPVKLKNPGFLKPFEVLTTSYGYPSYNAIDPTPFVAITFTLMFGLMFADIGYGLSLLFISLAVYLATTKKDEFMCSLNLILIAAGVSSLVFGVIFGEFFGGIVEVNAQARGFIEDISSLFLLSIMLGFAHISLSLISRLTTLHERREIIYSSSLLIILLSALPLYLGAYYVVGGLVSLGFLMLYYARGLAFFEEFIALIANILSYLRVGVLAVLHVTISELLSRTVLSLPASAVGAAVAAVLFLIGTALILASSAFLAFLHTLRLHWVEFFRRFYSGRGMKYEPFRGIARHVYDIA